MLQGIDITDDDIRYAERILLPEGKEFDDERKAFIRNLNTIDLQAVPGSGKTTALLAKLLIIERKLPFSDGSGILIISHTNTAIDEIKEKVQKHCPKLFSYPNFIGTIQSFVDTFLAIPMFVHWKGKKPIRIDSEIFWESLHKSLPYGSRLALEKRLGNKFKQLWRNYPLAQMINSFISIHLRKLVFLKSVAIQILIRICLPSKSDY